MKKFFFFPLIILFCAFTFSHKLQQKDYKFHSVFVYNFTKYIEWPNQNTQISIGVLNGGPALLDAFNKMAEVKSSGIVSYKIVKVNNASQAQQCQILFIPESESNQLENYVSALSGKPVLLITEADGLIKKGSCINFVIVDGKLNIELNRSAVEKAGLKVSGQLLALAILV
jgi:hypothetical protein